ncbi:MAG TPA: LysR substrate-binding domain-containing protein [Alphaproteobacteria bacterium]
MENLNDIWIFTNVVEKGSFSAAARALGLSASFVSKRVRFLEESLQIQLLNRSTHFVALTESGQIFYERCSESMRLLNWAKDEALEKAKNLKGKLRIFAALGLGEYVLWRLIAEFNKQFPEIVIDFEVGNRATNILESEIDIAFRSADLSDSSLERRDLGVLRYHICAAPSYLAQAGTPETPRDLTRFNCLINTAQHPTDRWRFKTASGEDYSVRINGTLHTNSGIGIFGACEMGVGISRLPAYVAREAFARGTLVELFPGESQFSRAIKAFYPRTTHIPSKITAFLDFTQQRLDHDLSHLEESMVLPKKRSAALQ